MLIFDFGNEEDAVVDYEVGSYDVCEELNAEGFDDFFDILFVCLFFVCLL